MRVVPSLDTVRRLVIKGQLTGDHELARAADGPWQRLGDIEQLKAYVRMAKSGGQKPQTEDIKAAESLVSPDDVEQPAPAPIAEPEASPQPEANSEPLQIADGTPKWETPDDAATDDSGTISSGDESSGIEPVAETPEDASPPALDAPPAPSAPPKPEPAVPSAQPTSEVQKKDLGSQVAVFSIIAALLAIIVFLLFHFGMI